MRQKTPRCPVEDGTLNEIDHTNEQGELVFDSMFGSGNLDLAIKVQSREFNLYLKPDTNTKGYCNWFFFKIVRRPDANGRYPKRKY